ncbi:MAG: TRAP transporter small permease subunit [Gammaproteobacteria bacterium]|jgi:TRAP-type mannitol/chloroaromatic compound transport system permease small subunit|nr:TRAP transporter small permease subunit [Gammaproteobacteria bacterium]MBU0828427.1 TRAP transporter small permease subunit [Gammaproteobacteria bacterium]MBU0889283.1 TRAP transporter small permease subunit [Gammaproteobacteria bacterium]MBU1819844.1 TRAP transporter small permease subunit [Gammaproteobacteria bacterium]
MPSWLSASTSAITTLNRWIFQVTVWLMAIVVPVMLYEVIARYVFNAPTVWGMELAVLLFGPYFLLGGPYLLHLKGHVALDVARQRLSPAWQRRLDLVNFPIIVLFCAILLYFSAPAAYSAFTYRETSFSAWNPPIWPVKAAVPLALALMLLQAVVEFFRTLFGESTADVSAAEAHP